ncbi:tRNA (adenosine(37)-N6)-threonylcarbamoyltransferase complex dimerization subunit type 1 TsaB [Rhizosaccharibacter radicis]|uniref:tRNA (Adenosine(37)-N6)-threonylcarbamoyltransferase complex dimerization subunit type 1 TsaB n=1 Tax=Rhizosaccharibacter radicis TaxID=2782605 RepID=A0ABT1VZY1_9PROT|nr:tRNA (adenosine(37)-N6)-threonylcarbamoyltransferase complex dimerization subunit type 1 TsaB [Acetobacteraceae bacterium KSS12]
MAFGHRAAGEEPTGRTASADRSETRILTLDGASAAAGARFALLRWDGRDPPETLAERTVPGRDGAERLPALLADALRAQGWGAGDLDMVAVVAGPGSFTGLRATLALAHGLRLGPGGMALVPVTVGEALAPELRAHPEAGRASRLWCVSRARIDRVFVEEVPADPAVPVPPPVAQMLSALSASAGVLLLAGDAAAAVAARISAAGGVPIVAGPERPDGAAIAAAALRRVAGDLPPLAAQPLYVDPPEARPAAPAAR